MAKKAQAKAGEISRIEITFDKPHLMTSIFGEFDRNLVTIENRLGVYISARGDRVQIEGEVSAAARARDILNDIYSRVQRGETIDAEVVQSVISMSSEPSLEGLTRKDDSKAPQVMIRTRKRTAGPAITDADAPIWNRCKRDDMIFALGPAGTGKTYLAVAQAVAMLISGAVDRLILSRPAVEAGEKLGFLPGDMKEKVDPYLRPIYDALYDCLPAEQVERRIASGEIEIAPLAFMRGRTLSDSFIILDEAQNTTREQMKMFLTRFGQNSRMVIAGDPRQVDIPGGAQHSGLADATQKLEGVDGVNMVRFTSADVVRHPLVGRIVDAYEDDLMIDIALDRSDAWPDGPDWEAAAQKSIAAAFAQTEYGGLTDSTLPISISILMTGDAQIQTLNQQYRGKDKPTNILSFPMMEQDELDAITETTAGELMLGDLAMAHETCAAEADDKAITLEQHVTHLIIHGTLHLLGYDHIADAEADAMEALEIKALASLGLPNPYSD